MTMLPPPYHIGLVVPDVRDAQAEITRALGVSWAKLRRAKVRMSGVRGVVDVEIDVVYTLEGPPYLELIQQTAGTVFEAPGLTHLGVWTDEPHAESARLESEGWPCESVNVKPDGSRAGGLFHIGACGLRLEVVDIGTSGPKLLRYLGGGDYA